VDNLELLELLCEPIDKIDGGCSHCIRNFIDGANKMLEADGVQYRFETAWETGKTRITNTDIEPPLYWDEMEHKWKRDVSLDEYVQNLQKGE